MAVLVLTSGLPLHYANRSFGEMVAAFFTVAFVASWFEGRTVLVGTTALLAALTKETAFPFLALLGLVCSIVCGPAVPGRRALWTSQRARFQAMAVGIAVAIFVSIALNLFRSGVAYNPAYLGYTPIKPPVATQLRLFFALWFAPNAGLLFFWPLFVIMFLSIPLAVRWYSPNRPPRTLAPFFGVALLLTLLTALLAGWWAPFGWWAWGQRLTVPWLPASLLALCFAYSAELEMLILQLLRTRLRAALLTAIVIVLALPHVASIFRSAQLIHDTFAHQPDCDEPAPSEIEVARYYRCVERLAWTDPSPLIRAYRLLPHPFVRMRALIYSALLAVGGASLYRAARETGLRASLLLPLRGETADGRNSPGSRA
jgi:hypothetical protein